MSDVFVTIGLAVCGLLVHASWRLSAVATRLEDVCDRLGSHERKTDEQVRRIHERIDELGKKAA